MNARQPALAALVLALLTAAAIGFPSAASAQDGQIKIGVIDMQECLTKFWETDRDTATLNELAKEKRSELDDRNADYMKLNKLIADEDKRARATELPPETRNAAIAKLQELLQERAAKQNEIQEFQRRIQAEMLQARTQMEATLVDKVKEVVAEVAKGEGLHIVHDRSFLPRANKAIVYIDDEAVTDITEAVIAKLNVDAPEPKPGETTGESSADDASTPAPAPEGGGDAN